MVSFVRSAGICRGCGVWQPESHLTERYLSLKFVEHLAWHGKDADVLGTKFLVPF